MVSIIALWVLVLFETVLLVLLLRALGELRQQGAFSGNQRQSSQEWGLALGEQAPSFVAVDQHGRFVRMEDFQGQRRILAFVSPGCAPCAGTVAVLNAFLQEERNVTVLVVGSSDHKQNHVYAVEHDAQMPVLTPDSDVDNAYHVNVKPFVFALDETGTVRAKGPLNHHEHLESVLTKAFPSLPVSR